MPHFSVMGLPRSHAQFLVGPTPHFSFMGLPGNHAQFCSDDNVCCRWGARSHHARASNLVEHLIRGTSPLPRTPHGFGASSRGKALLRPPERVPRSFHLAHRHRLSTLPSGLRGGLAAPLVLNIPQTGGGPGARVEFRKDRAVERQKQLRPRSARSIIGNPTDR